MLSHTYHDPISCLDLIFEFVKSFFANFIFYAYFIKRNFKALPEKLFSAGLSKFFRRIKKKIDMKNHINLKFGDVLTSP